MSRCIFFVFLGIYNFLSLRSFFVFFSIYNLLRRSVSFIFLGIYNLLSLSSSFVTFISFFLIFFLRRNILLLIYWYCSFICLSISFFKSRFRNNISFPFFYINSSLIRRLAIIFISSSCSSLSNFSCSILILIFLSCLCIYSLRLNFTFLICSPTSISMSITRISFSINRLIKRVSFPFMNNCWLSIIFSYIFWFKILEIFNKVPTFFWCLCILDYYCHSFPYNSSWFRLWFSNFYFSRFIIFYWYSFFCDIAHTRNII